MRVRDARVTGKKKEADDGREADGGEEKEREREERDRSCSANNVFVYSTRVVRRETTILVYVHQYLDSSRKPN